MQLDVYSHQGSGEEKWKCRRDRNDPQYLYKRKIDLKEEALHPHCEGCLFRAVVNL